MRQEKFAKVFAGLAIVAIAAWSLLERRRRERREDAEGALRESEERYRAVVEQSTEGIYLVDGDTRRILETNRALREMLGYPAGELLEMELYDLIAHDPEDVDRNLQRTLEERSRFVGERRYRRKDGSLLDVEVGAGKISYGGREVVCAVVRDIAGRKEAEEALKKSEEQFHSLVENAGDAFFVHDLDGRFVDANRLACESLGYTREELLGLSVVDVETNFVPENLRQIWVRLVSGTPITLDGLHRRKDGSVFPVEIRLGVFETGGRRLMLALARDVTEREKVQAALRESEARFRQLFEHSVDTLLVHDEEGRFVDCNSEACRSLGYTREELLELSVKDVATDLLSEEERRALGDETLWGKALRGKPGATVNFHQNRHRRKDGTTFPVEVGVGSIDYAGRRLIFASARDITERVELEKRLTHQAFHDPLTGLPNRTLFLDRLGHALATANRRERSVAVLFLDLDDFKTLNDSLGHAAGDALLVATARRLAACLRTSDTVARLGGDEFTVLLEDVSSPEEAERVVDRLMDAFAAPFEVGGREVLVTASVGVVSEAPPGSNPEALLEEADAAMYRAKERGKARYEVYEGDVHAHVMEHLDLEKDLRRAVESLEGSTGGEEEFEVHYQPKVLLASREVAGLEALVRWRRPGCGLVPPASFLPVAEETGMILSIDGFVLREACRRMKAWRDARAPCDPLPFVGVNVSARRFRRPGFAEEVGHILYETGLDPGGLVLEIPERVATDDVELSVRRFEELKDIGIGLALDGFGKGHSSLSSLRRFPVDYLEIDHSFVDGLGEVLEDTIKVSGMLGVARSLGLRVVAEGIEKAEQLAQLEDLGCDIGQGYHFSKPLLAGEVEAFLAGPSA